MNTTDALNASLILLHENTSQTPQDTDEDESKIPSYVALITGALLPVVVILGVVAVVRVIWRIRRSNRTTKATVVCDKETEISPLSEPLYENTPDLVGCASTPVIKDVSRTGPYGKEDTPLLAIAGTKYSRNVIGSGSAFEFNDEVQTEIGYPNCNLFSSNNECRMSIVSEQCHHSSFESVLFDESNLILNDQPIHATERFGDGCSDSNGHNKARYDESIEYMKHVKSPVGEDGEDPDETCPKTVKQTEPNDIDYNLLDWNRVFVHLAERIEASKWTWFFIKLYGNSQCELKGSVSQKLDQVEHEFKGRRGNGDTVSHLIYQFEAWKQCAGSNAKHTMIDKTLKEMEWNDKLDEFRKFMKNPPLLSSNCDQLQNQLMLDTSFKGSLPSFTSFPILSGTGIENAVNDKRNITHSRGFQSHGKVRYTYEMSYEVDNKQPNNESPNHERSYPDGEDSVNCGRNVKEDELQTTNNTTEQNIEVKEITDKACSSNLQKRPKLLSGNNKGKGINVKTKRLRTKVQKHQRARKRTQSCQKLSTKSYKMLIRNFLMSAKRDLEEDMYTRTLQDTISEIVKETRVSERVILSLTCEAYHDMDKTKTKRENLYIMYSENIRLTLGESAFEELKLFTEIARQQVIDRLAKNIDKESQKYLFIDFHGKRIHSTETNPELADDKNSDGSSFITIEDCSAFSEEDDL